MDIDTEAWIIATSHQFAWWLRQEAEMQEQTFAAGECPNCGHDWTAHGPWIANPGDRTCVTVDLIGSECDIADELAVIAIQYDERDPIIHTDALPYCSDMTCPCHGCTTWAQVEDMIDYLGKPFDAGLLTSAEQSRLFEGRQV